MITKTANNEICIFGKNSEDDNILIAKENINDVLSSNDVLRLTSSINKNHTENTDEEKWDRKSAKQRKLNSYLSLNPHLRHLDLNNSRKIKSIPVLNACK
jgi:hypothetical protein